MTGQQLPNSHSEHIHFRLLRDRCLQHEIAYATQIYREWRLRRLSDQWPLRPACTTRKSLPTTRLPCRRWSGPQRCRPTSSRISFDRIRRISRRLMHFTRPHLLDGPRSSTQLRTADLVTNCDRAGSVVRMPLERVAGALVDGGSASRNCSG